MADAQQDVLAIFTESLARESLEERLKYLDEACQGAPQVRDRVETLLRAHADAGNFLGGQSPVVAATIDFPSIAELPGTQIGPYKLLEQIGEGGMGVVYVASQKEPLRRKVALKIIKPGMDTREVVARFEAERQALALMDHPNIAKVFDAGATDAGRPYFAMELVKGTPITEYCDREQLSTRERLELFVTLCQGVQHAHQKGVIHRDLKPSNLLVEVHDVRPVPKIIDFGIAKAVGQQLTEKTFYTAHSQMVGTPLYMSPEQAGQSAVDVDTRSDIYSLGVLLYELLTGYTPFEKDTLRTVGVDEMRRIIREVDPPRPSARVSTLQAADLSTVCERRSVEPHKLSQELRGELDWIVMKAMDKDRDRRYATVNDLAADVERYLHDEPVQACPPSVAYRFTKFARRNQVALVTSALVALALIVGTGVSVWQALVATRAKQQTAQALLKAEERLQFGRQAVDDMYTQFAEKWLAQQVELTQVQQQFLEKALAFYQRLATEEGTDPAVLFEAAVAEKRVADIEKKLDQHTEAEAAYRRAVVLFEQLAREAQEPAKYNQGLANSRIGLGQLLSFTGRSTEAEREHRLALTLCQTLAAQYPDDTRYQRDLALSHDELGGLLRRIGKPDQAEQAFRQSVALLRPLRTRFPDDSQLNRQLAASEGNLAWIMEDTSPVEADNLYRSVASSAAELVKDDPGNPEYRGFLADQLQSRSMLLPKLGRLPEAEANLRKVVTIEEELVQDFPQVPAYQLRLANALAHLSDCVAFSAKSEESEQVLRRSLEIMEKLAADHPQVPVYRNGVAGGLNNVATNLMDRGKWDDARPLLEKAIAHQQAGLKLDPLNADASRFLAIQLENLTGLQIHLGDNAAAARTAEELARHILLNVDDLVATVAYTSELSIDEAAQCQHDARLSPQRQEARAKTLFLVVKSLLREAVQRAPDDPTQWMIADLLTTAPEPLRDPDLALKLARRAMELKPEDGMCQRSLGWALWRSGDYRGCIEVIGKQADEGMNGFVLAMARWQLGEKTEAQTLFDGGSEWLKGYEQRCEEALKQGTVKYPLPVQMKRLQAEAAAMLGVTPPTVEPAPAPAAKVEEAQELPKTTPAPESAKEEEKPQ